MFDAFSEWNFRFQITPVQYGRDLRKAQQEHNHQENKNKRLLNSTIAVHVCYNSWFISLYILHSPENVTEPNCEN